MQKYSRSLFSVIIIASLLLLRVAIVHADPHGADCHPCCASIYNGFWVSCEGAQSVGYDGGWVWVRYEDDALNNFQEDHSIEFEWILPSDDYVYKVTAYYTNFISPEVDNADGALDPGTNEYGIAERKPAGWVKGNTYQASFLIDGYLPDNIKIDLEIELNKWAWIIWPIWGYWDPDAGCYLEDIPPGNYADWVSADRTLACYVHHTYEYSSSPEIRGYKDYVTVNLITIKKMKELQKKYDLNITGFELFDPKANETAGAFLLPGETIDDGLKRLKELGITNLSNFKVFAIKLDHVPPDLLDDSVVLTLGRVHPNDDEWDSLGKREEGSMSITSKVLIEEAKVEGGQHKLFNLVFGHKEDPPDIVHVAATATAAVISATARPKRLRKRSQYYFGKET